MATPVESLVSLLKAACAAQDASRVVEVLNRIQSDFHWTEVEDNDDQTILEDAVRLCYSAFPSNSSVANKTEETIEKIEYDKTRSITRAWFHQPPLPAGIDADSESGLVTITFIDETPAHKAFVVEDAWEPQTVRGALSEPFRNIFQRFRLEANRRYRHPFLPSISFSVLVPGPVDSSGSRGPDIPPEFIPFRLTSSFTVGELIERLPEDSATEVSYVRNDDEWEARQELQRSPAWSQEVWERELPPWFRVPSHWISPARPSDSDAGSTTIGRVISYREISPLQIPGNGRNILPITRTPSVIAARMFLPVVVFGDLPNVFVSDPDRVYVAPQDRLVPGNITVSQATALVGRAFQCSPVPPDIDQDSEEAEDLKMMHGTYDERYVSMAWGLDPTEGNMCMHCVLISGRSQQKDFIVNLSTRLAEKPVLLTVWNPLAVEERYCEWIGLATL